MAGNRVVLNGGTTCGQEVYARFNLPRGQFRLPVCNGLF